MKLLFCYFYPFFIILGLSGSLLAQNYANISELEKKLNNNKLLNDKKLLSLQPQKVAQLFTGFFSNENTIADSSQKQNASLMICVPIWQNKQNKDKIAWLYLSRAYVGQESRPFSQYIYKIEKRNDSLIAKIFNLSRETALANRFAWLEKQPLSAISPDSLEANLNCIFLIINNNKGFYIRALGGDCPFAVPNGNIHSMDLQFFLRPERVESSVSFFDKNGKLVFNNPNQLYERLTGKELNKVITQYLKLAQEEAASK